MWKRSYYQDEISPEFILVGGWRRVRKNGTIKIAKAWFQSDKLIAYIEQDVWCDCSEFNLDGKEEIKVFEDRYENDTFITNAQLRKTP